MKGIEMKNNEQDRVEFEDWAIDQPCIMAMDSPFSLNPYSGEYESAVVSMACKAWQESRAAMEAEQDEAVELPEPDFYVRPGATIHPDRGWECWSNDGTATGVYHAHTVRALQKKGG